MSLFFVFFAIALHCRGDLRRCFPGLFRDNLVERSKPFCLPPGKKFVRAELLQETVLRLPPRDHDALRQAGARALQVPRDVQLHIKRENELPAAERTDSHANEEVAFEEARL